MLEGRYEKYLDDFRNSTRHWNDVWGTLICEYLLVILADVETDTSKALHA